MLSTGKWLLPAPAGQDVSGTRQDVTAGSCSAYRHPLVRAGGPLQYHCPQMENHCSHAHGHLIQETGQPEVHQ